MKMMFCAEEEKEPVVKKILDKDSGGELTESLLDAVIALNPSLTRLDDAAFAAGCRGKGKVSLISGGGSGHEPAHAGFVGEGALTAAVCGDVFASPSAKAVLAAIVATASPAGGCLLIVKNYTGDRLNFGIAAATATSRYGIPVETVYVADDVALSNAESPRGLAGTLAVHKVAGAAAAAGAPLADVAAAARATASAVKTMGVAYEVCAARPPGVGPPRPGEIELGLGIHGEPGAEKSPTLAASDVADKLAEACVNALPAGDDVALIINDLGATTPMELAVFGAAAKRAVERRGKTVKRILSGGLMTALDMHGPTAPPAPLVAPDASVIDDVAPAAVENDLVDARLANALRAATKAIVDGEESLTAMDEKVGDGDCGITLAQGAKAAVSLLDRAGGAPRGACAFLAALSEAVEDSMGGSSGALYNLGLKAAEKSMRDAVKAHAGDWSDADADAAWKRAFVAFAGAISECGGAKDGVADPGAHAVGLMFAAVAGAAL
ncbi:glycerone kinase [Aureococcus anophagefferens]|nr:glycerone kinase [Aureococcus anophagefferens]